MAFVSDGVWNNKAKLVELWMKVLFIGGILYIIHGDFGKKVINSLSYFYILIIKN